MILFHDCNSPFSKEFAEFVARRLTDMLPDGIRAVAELGTYDRLLRIGVFRDGVDLEEGYITEIEFGWVARTDRFNGRNTPPLTKQVLLDFAQAVADSERERNK